MSSNERRALATRTEQASSLILASGSAADREYRAAMLARGRFDAVIMRADVVARRTGAGTRGRILSIAA